MAFLLKRRVAPTAQLCGSEFMYNRSFHECQWAHELYICFVIIFRHTRNSILGAIFTFSFGIKFTRGPVIMWRKCENRETNTIIHHILRQESKKRQDSNPRMGTLTPTSTTSNYLIYSINRAIFVIRYISDSHANRRKNINSRFSEMS